MKKKLLFSFPALLGFVCCLGVLFSTTSCKKEYITQAVAIDSIKVTKSLLTGKWLNTQTVYRIYSGGNLQSSKVEFYTGNSFGDFKGDMTYTNQYMGAPAGSGTWDVSSASQIVFDKGNATEERYYYILALDAKILITDGPYKKNGTFWSPTNTVFYTYYTK
jgi:hypothetical protein